MGKSTSFTGRRGFTLVELLVVIGIIAVLVSILLPAISQSRKTAQNVKCMSNMRQLGMAFNIYFINSRGWMPWTGFGDGDKSAKPIGPWDDESYWANAIPPLVNGKSYYQLQQDDAQGRAPLSYSNEKNLFVCPAAGAAASYVATDTVTNGYFMMWGNPEGSKAQYLNPPAALILPPDQRKTFWCYVINSKLDNTRSRLKVSQLTPSTEVALLVEKGMNGGEVTPSYSTQSLMRGKTTWTRFTTRHYGGGNILFVDGHVGSFLNKELEPPNGVVPSGNAAYNLQAKVTWDPFQVPKY